MCELNMAIAGTYLSELLLDDLCDAYIIHKHMI